MVSQGFIQPIAQDAQQTIPNNGNPNTVYNRAAPAAPVQGWAASPITPAANFNGNDPQQTIANSNANIAQNGWVAPAADPAVKQGQGVLQLPEGWADQIKNFTPTAPTTTPNTPATPQYDLNKQWIVMDGNVPRKNTDLYNTDPAYKAAFDQINAEYGAREKGKSIEQKSSGPQDMTTALKAFYQAYYDNGWRPDDAYIASAGKTGNVNGTNSPFGAEYYSKVDPNGWKRLQSTVNNSTSASAGASGGSVGSGNKSVGYSGIGLGNKMVDGAQASDIVNNVIANDTAPRASNWNSDSAKNVAENLTSFVDSSIASLSSNATAQGVMKFLDAISEPFLPGNLYMSELGQVNMPNLLSAVMNKAVPGLGTLGKWLATKIPESATGLLGKLRDWVLNGKFQEAGNAIYKQYDMDKARESAIYGNKPAGGGGSVNEGGGGYLGGWLGGSSGSNGGAGYGGYTGNVTIGDWGPITTRGK